MAHYRLLDADFLINLIRTLSLIKKHDNSIDNKIEQICNESHYSFISTKIVENEVNVITKMLNPRGHDLFFAPIKNDAFKIKKEIFGAIRFIDMRKNPSMNIYNATGQKNLGEISLAVLLSSRYAEFINSSGNSVKIVSNNTNDVIGYLNDMAFCDICGKVMKRMTKLCIYSILLIASLFRIDVRKSKITTKNGFRYTKGWYEMPRKSKDRSRTFKGIAEAMASQWG